MNSEIRRLIEDPAWNLTNQQAKLVKAAIELAYHIGVRDGYKDARMVLGLGTKILIKPADPDGKHHSPGV